MLNGKLFLICTMAAGLTACATSERIMMEPTNTVTPKIELRQDYAVTRIDEHQLSQDAVDEVVRHYNRAGSGPLYAVIAYHPDEKEAKYTPITRDVKKALKMAGVADARVVELAANTVNPYILVGYDALIAEAPAECEGRQMAGVYHDNNIEDDYKLGCTVTDMIAKQVSDPRDFRGRSGLGGVSDGQRAAAVNDVYRAGETQEFLPSYFISELTSQ